MNHLLQPANPTFPIQDKFGNVQISFGLTKIEYVAALVYASMNQLPANAKDFDFNYDKMADAAVNRAIKLLNAVQDRMIEMASDQQKKDSNLILHK